jgi:hypothetical protein
MTGIKYQVELRETDTEFLLFIHASQKERAREIEGRRWDTERRCWVYPKTARVYDAIIAEFGDNIVSTSIKRPTLPSISAQKAALQIENQHLQKELEKIHKTLELISKGTNDGKRSEVKALEAALAAQENELSASRKQLQERERELTSLKKSITASHTELEILRVANATLKLELSKRPASSGKLVENFQKLVKDIAKEAAGRDPEFGTIIDRLLLNETLPNEFVKQLERKLRKHLHTDDRTLSLHDLIMMAKDAELLTEKGIDIAHTLRKHRNILTHESTDPRTHVARVLFCLFAASLLWPEFSK